MYELTMAAANLKVAAPEQFEQFVGTIRQLEDRQTTDLIAADSSGIFRAQGRASIMVELRKRLETCLEKRKSYQTKL